MIFTPDEHADRIYLIMSGHVRLYMIHEGGKEISLALLGPGDIFGELALFVEVQRTRFAQAFDTVVLQFAPTDKFLENIKDRPDLIMEIAAIISRRVIRAEMQIENLAYTSVPGRLHAVLLELVNRFGEPSDEGMIIPLRLSQQELASFAGTTRESCSVALRKLVRNGTIKLTKDRRIIVTDRGRLRAGMGDRLRAAFRIRSA